jgi:hypothetical protein
MPTGPASPQRSLLRFTCHTAVRNPPRPLVGATVAVVFPALARRGLCPSQSRGAERRMAPGHAPAGECPHTPCGERARPLARGRCAPLRGDAAPFGAPRGVLRPSGIDLPFDGAFSALALSVPGIGLANYRRGVVVPRADPGAARGQPCLRMHGGAGAAPRSALDASRSALE